MRFVTAYQKVFLLRGDLGARFFHLTSKKIVLENFAKLKGKKLSESLFFNNVTSHLRDSTCRFQENICVRVSFFDKTAGLSLQLY